MKKLLLVVLLATLVLPVLSEAGEKVEVKTSSGQVLSVSPETADVIKGLLRRRQELALSHLGDSFQGETQKTAVQAEAVTVVSASSVIKIPAKTETVAEKTGTVKEREGNFILSGSGSGAQPFNEFSAWGGGWYNFDHDSKGLWAQGEYFRKYSPREEPENFGLGIIAKADYGKLNSQVDWGYLGIGPSVSYWRALTLEDEFQVKLRLPYRWDMNDRGDGWMPGFYAEYARTLSAKDKLILSAEGWHFTDDSYLGFQAMGERWISRTTKLRYGGAAFWNYLGDGNHFGWGPALQFKFWDKLTVGGFYNIPGKALGAIIGYDYNSAVEAFRKKHAQNRVKMENQAVKVDFPIGEVSLVSDGNGAYSTLPGGEGLIISNKTIADEIRERQGETP